MIEKSANPGCSQPFDCQQGRLYCCHLQPVEGLARGEGHGVKHYWLCGSCSNAPSFEHRASPISWLRWPPRQVETQRRLDVRVAAAV